jgi:cobalamin biosynthetic protein CobC
MNARSAADPFRFHGGRLAAAAAHFDRARQPWVDLSTGICPWAYPVPDNDPAIWHRLPEPEELEQLEAAAAESFGVPDPDEVVAVPGSDIAIRLLGTIFSDRAAAMLTPIYSGHRATWPDAAEVTMDDAAHHDLLILANPNNPDGRKIAPQRLRELPGQLIVDEAFADTDPEISLLQDRAGAIVLRSFGKFFGLPGIRLGFVIADLPVAHQLRRLLGDWPVSGSAIAIGTSAYRDQTWQHHHRQRISRAANALDHMLEQAGLEIAGGTSLFRLATHDQASEIFEHLGQSGILVRPFATDERQLRFGLPASDADRDRLAKALQDWRQK